MKFARIAAKVLFEPWAILPATHASLLQQLRARIESPAPMSFLESELETDEEPEMEVALGLALVPISGLIGKRLSMIETFCGGCDLEAVSEMIRFADEDPTVHTILLDFDSPGGTVTGLPETARLIRSVATRKKVIAFCDVQCCSAAYWLASQASEFYCTESATIGSIGAFIAGVDTSEEWAKTGWALELFRGGTLKALGIDGKKWTDEDRAFLQASVDKTTADFRAAVRLGRGEVADATMQGQWFDGAEAVLLNLCDGMVENIQEVVNAAVAAHYMKSAAL